MAALSGVMAHRTNPSGGWLFALTRPCRTHNGAFHLMGNLKSCWYVRHQGRDTLAKKPTGLNPLVSYYPDNHV